MVKRLYPSLTAIGFLVPFNYGELSLFFTSLADVSPVEEKDVSEWCRTDRLNGQWAAYEMQMTLKKTTVN